MYFVFFFQAEDGIRDLTVTGVQTCALPIYNELTAGGISILPSIDAIQEFKVLTYNYSAEYGTRAGPTVLVTTKSGANDFHGSLFEFFRNTSLDARSFFASEREKFNLNQFGGALGGPLKKNKKI